MILPRGLLISASPLHLPIYVKRNPRARYVRVSAPIDASTRICSSSGAYFSVSIWSHSSLGYKRSRYMFKRPNSYFCSIEYAERPSKLSFESRSLLFKIASIRSKTVLRHYRGTSTHEEGCVRSCTDLSSMD
jgi:hypothetical protein